MNPEQTEIVNKVRRFFEPIKELVANRTICVCLSGGADSVALLYLLRCVSEEFRLNICACHFNHMIRGQEADRDEEFCKIICEQLGIKIYCGRDDVPAYSKLYSKTLEEAARECRYAFFSRVLAKNNIDFCATAHNKNDDAETLIMNLIRGTGSNGASSISPIKSNILRPLLKVSRNEIEQYLHTIKASFVNDSTNDSDDYTRNYIRHVVLPAMSKINPNVVESLSRYTESCRNDRDFFDVLIEENINNDLTDLHKSLRDRIILRKYKDFCGSVLYRTAVSGIEKAIGSGIRTVISVNKEHDAVIKNGNVEFYHKFDVPAFDLSPQILKDGVNSFFADRVTLIVSDENVSTEEYINKIVISQKLSFDNIVGDIYVRTRREGDRITVFGVNKSVKKLFNEKKIPKEYRGIVPVFYDDLGIIYIPFVAVADRVFPKSPNKAKILTTVFNSIDKERWSNANEK